MLILTRNWWGKEDKYIEGKTTGIWMRVWWENYIWKMRGGIEGNRSCIGDVKVIFLKAFSIEGGRYTLSGTVYLTG